MKLQPGDWVKDRRTGTWMRFSCWRHHPKLGRSAHCFLPGEPWNRRVKMIPVEHLEKLRKRQWIKTLKQRA